jgi:UDP-N-acetylglucosamine:LPS N-acetylglucosamine transferase
LPAAELCSLIMSSDLIISRSGYTTVMDLAALRKKSILIPTPGQTEQEYLGEYLMQNKFCLCIGQDAFSLASALQQAGSFDFADMHRFNLEQYKCIRLFIPPIYLPVK